MPVQTNDAYERLFELVVNERVTERVDWTVEVAQPVGDVIQRRRDARTTAVGRLDCAVASAAAEADQQRQDVPRRPAGLGADVMHRSSWVPLTLGRRRKYCRSVPRGPAENERSEDDRDRTQCLAGPVLLLLLLFPAQSLGFGARIAATVARHDKVPESRHCHTRQRLLHARPGRLVLVGGRRRHDDVTLLSCSRNGFRLDVLLLSLQLRRRWGLYYHFRFVDRHVFGRPRR